MLSYGISLRKTKSALYLWELLQNTSFQLCRWLALWVVLHSYLSVSCYDDVIFNFYYFNTVPIGKHCSLPLMRFNQRIFCMLFYFIAEFKRIFKIFQCFNVHHWNLFLTNVVNQALQDFILWKWSQQRYQNISGNEFRSFGFIYH